MNQRRPGPSVIVRPLDPREEPGSDFRYESFFRRIREFTDLTASAYLSASWTHDLKALAHLHVSNRTHRAFVASEETPATDGRQENSLKKTEGCGIELRLTKHVYNEVFGASSPNSSDVDPSRVGMFDETPREAEAGSEARSPERKKAVLTRAFSARGVRLLLRSVSGAGPHARPAAPVDYFLCRCRFRSLRCLCLRIFFRRFLITLPTLTLLSLRLFPPVCRLSGVRVARTGFARRNAKGASF